jgi:hypothetical protein
MRARVTGAAVAKRYKVLEMAHDEEDVDDAAAVPPARLRQNTAKKVGRRKRKRQNPLQ